MLGLDFETTGVDPHTDRIVTATIVSVRPNGEVASAWEWLADPGVDIPAEATEMHGITTDHAQAHGWAAPDVVADIVDKLNTWWAPDIPLVVYNASYDLTMLIAECRRHNVDCPVPHRSVVDPMICDRGVDRYRKGGRKLGQVCKHYGVDLLNAHTSAADSVAAVQLARVMAGKWPRLGLAKLYQLYVMQRRWSAEWAAFLQEYKRTKADPPDPEALVDGSWPVYPLRDPEPAIQGCAEIVEGAGPCVEHRDGWCSAEDGTTIKARQ